MTKAQSWCHLALEDTKTLYGCAQNQTQAKYSIFIVFDAVVESGVSDFKVVFIAPQSQLIDFYISSCTNTHLKACKCTHVTCLRSKERAHKEV